MKRLYSLFLCFVLLLGSVSHLTGCTEKEKTEKSTFSYNIYASYREDLSEEELEYFNALATSRVSDFKHRLAHWQDNVEGTLSTDPTIYYLKASIDQGQTKKNLKEKVERPVVLRSSELYIPIFVEYSSGKRIRGEIDRTYGIVLYGTEETYDTGHYTRIYEKIPSVSLLNDLCRDKDLGELQSATIFSLMTYNPYRDFILLETEKGSYVYDPMGYMIEITDFKVAPDPSLFDEGQIYDSTYFFTTYFDYLEEKAQSEREQSFEMLKSFFEELIEQVFS